MNRKDIEYVLRELGVRKINQSGDHLMIPCILAPWTHERGTDSKPSCGIKISKGVSVVNCFACHTSTGLLNYVRDYGRYAVADGLVDSEKINNLLDFILMAEDDDSDIEEVKVVVKREVPKDLEELIGKNTDKLNDFKKANGTVRILGDSEWWSKWGLSYIEEDTYVDQFEGKPRKKTIENRIMFPIYDIDKSLRMVQGRWFDNNYDDAGEPKYCIYPRGADKENYLYGIHMYNSSTTKFLVVEGMIDTVNANYVLKENGFDDWIAVGINGSKISDKQVDLIRAYAEEVLILLDRDQAGRLGQKQAIEKLKNFVNVTVSSYPDDEKLKDPDDLALNGKLIEVLDNRKSQLEMQLLKVFQSTK